MDPLLDREFLNKLDRQKNRETYIRIAALNYEEEPIEQIEGRASGGSINIDGTSTVRRTCSLTLVTDELNINDFYWGIKCRFRLEIGLRNYTDTSYPDIIWFPQGVYVITQFNITYNSKGYTIAISGKDKMCLLNGDISGALPATIDFGVEEIEDPQYSIYTNNETITLDLTTANLQAVDKVNVDNADNASMSESVIIYKDIEIKTIIKEMVHAYGGEQFHNIIINDLDDYGYELMEYRGSNPLYLLYNKSDYEYDNFSMDGTIPCSGGGSTCLADIPNYEQRIEGIDSSSTATTVRFNASSDSYTVTKVEYGDVPGYRVTPLTYAGDLISKPGDSVTSILDKIKSMLGEYEYFYDVDGHFVFQKKRNYLQTTWNNIVKDEDQEYVAAQAISKSTIYDFGDTELIQSIQTNPSLNNLKNDFIVWGTRETVSGAEIDVHMRYAIDEKPTQYYSITDSKLYTTSNYDWRELIFQMARDSYQYGHEDDFVQRLNVNVNNYPDGKTGYEQYYVDMISFWRELYNKTDTADSDEFLASGWNKKVSQSPETLNFWFDFLDPDGELASYSVKRVGDRPKVVSSSDIKAVYYREIPGVVFASEDDMTTYNLSHETGYNVMQLGNDALLETLFVTSAQGKSAKDEIDELVYNYSYCTESATLTTIPIYYLEPNYRISLLDKESGINAEYIITKINIPLFYNGTMSISATKVPAGR